MNLYNLVAAHQNFNSVISLNLPYSVIRNLRRLRAKLADEFDFYCGEERKLIAANGITVSENGVLDFPNEGAKKKYLSAITDLKNMDSDVEITPVEISESDIGNQRISLECLDALEGFIKIG